MKRIGLISDTHGYLDEKVFEHFAEVDEIWHGGDIGGLELADDLKKFKPLRAVYGNIDDAQVRAEFPLDNRFELEGFDVWITHIGGYPRHYHPRVKNILQVQPPDIFICGHSHILKVMRDTDYKNMLCLNPGAAGIHGFHRVKTLLRFSLHNKQISNMEAIEMGKRGEIK